MGWDAFSSYNNKSKSKQNLAAKKAFKEASEHVMKLTGTVDGYLGDGGLDCSDCRHMLEKAANLGSKNLNWGLAYGESGMSPFCVKVVFGFSNWDFKFSKQDAWAYWSAREFLRICAENNLSIRFDY